MHIRLYNCSVITLYVHTMEIVIIKITYYVLATERYNENRT